ncbi:MBL fold metallo-hydrolase [Halosegnis sp.]|uniref:MBL fold metallo-hydrolase n=1 Tax=Halosegnis sp. TaxID=2864959 RepID=UPI0035D3DD56
MTRRLATGLWLLESGLVTPLATNAYLIDARECDGPKSAVTLVDTGLPVNYPSLPSELADAGYEPADIDRVLLTHYDIDHVGGLRELDGFDGPVYLGERDAALARGDWTPTLFHHKGLFHRLARPFFDFKGVDLRPLADGERIGDFTAHHTPGHNPGHVVYAHERLDTVFLGDLVWAEAGGFTPPFWLDSYNMRRLRESIRRLAEGPPFERGLVAHGDPVLTGASERLRELTATFA